jgi:RimJ/RimL family protein N-acetyltransferase
VRTDGNLTTLETERLILRRTLPEDAERISAYRSVPSVREMQGWERTDVAAVLEGIEEMRHRLPGEEGWVQFSLILRESGELVGDVGLSPASEEPDVMKVGYTVAPEFQGRGFATEAVGALVAYSLDVLDAQVVRMYASADNVASIRVAEKVGMDLMETFEGHDGDEVWQGVRYEIRVTP